MVKELLNRVSIKVPEHHVKKTAVVVTDSLLPLMALRARPTRVRNGILHKNWNEEWIRRPVRARIRVSRRRTL